MPGPSNSSAVRISLQKSSSTRTQSNIQAERGYRERESNGFAKLSGSVKRLRQDPPENLRVQLTDLPHKLSRPQTFDLASDGIDVLMDQSEMLRQQNGALTEEITALRQRLLALEQANFQLTAAQVERHPNQSYASPLNNLSRIQPPRPAARSVSTMPFQQGFTPSVQDPQHQEVVDNNFANTAASPLRPHDNLMAFPSHQPINPIVEGNIEWQQVLGNPDSHYCPPSSGLDQSEYL